MRYTTLGTRILVLFLGLSLLAVSSSTWVGTHALRRFHEEEVRVDLAARAALFAGLVADGAALRGAAADALCKEMGRRTETRYTVVLPDGRVAGDSERDPREMENHADRPEVAEALAGRSGTAVRYSDTLRRNLMYCTVPVRDSAGSVLGVVRAAVPLTTLERHLSGTLSRMVTGSLGVLAAAALLAWFAARHIGRPLEDMRWSAGRFARGDLTHRVPVPPTDELAGLAEALNRMASQLDDRIRTVVRERNQREAVLSAMIEGVLVVDPEERLVGLNRAAVTLLGVEEGSARGRTVPEIVRNSEIQAFVSRALRSSAPVETDVVLHGRSVTYLQVHGAAMRGEGGEVLGAVIVFNDVSRLKRLESIQRDFVANATHELKTPITSVKGAVETLLGGAMADPEEARRFLDIAERHSQRLCTLIDDLLLLSRIEYEAERHEIPFVDGSLGTVIASAATACRDKAAARGVSLRIAAAQDARRPINAQLLEQAVVNLVDNAVKYSPDGGEVAIALTRADGDDVIRVTDQGCGIELQHQARLFERFYRADKARSRKLGGTGLGLAIVKQIVLAHGGSVSVESQPGRGSTFSIHMPPPAVVA